MLSLFLLEVNKVELKKGDKVVYVGDMPYKLANGQEVEKEGEELFVKSNVYVQPEFFKVVEQPKEEIKVEKAEVKITKKPNKK
jgi:hypothetical protein